MFRHQTALKKKVVFFLFFLNLIHPFASHSADDLHRSELLTAIEQAKTEWRDLEREKAALVFSSRKALRLFQTEKQNLNNLRQPPQGSEGLYYEEARNQILSARGSFYELHQEEKREAVKELKILEKKRGLADQKRKDQKRRILQTIQRLKDYEQANQEAWPRNPF